MTTYNLKKETKLYIVRNNLKYSIDLYPDLSFSQTFDETSVPVKTLHSQFNMYENAVITKANPANFNFTIPILLEQDMNIVLELLRDWDSTSSEASLKTADLYLENSSEVYKLEKAVVESGVFQITRTGLLTLAISGTARKLSKFTGNIPGSLQIRSISRTYTAPTSMQVTIGGVIQPYITSVTVELKNNVQWVDFATLQNSIGINDASGTMFAGDFVVSSRTLSGTIQQYVTDETNSNVTTWSIGSPIVISTRKATNTDWDAVFNIPAAVFTNRLDVQDLYVQSYDFRMISNPSNLNSIIGKRNI